MTFIPRHNAAAEHIDWVLWAQKLLLEQAAQIERLSAGLAAAGKQTATGASQTAIINNRLVRRGGDTSRGLPDGGYRGAIVTQDVSGVAKWTTPIGSIIPQYTVHLEDANSDYWVSPFGSYLSYEEAKTVMPAVLIEDNGLSLDWSPSWGDELADGTTGLTSNNMPVMLTVSVMPQFDGQEFRVVPPQASTGAPWCIVDVYNFSDTFSAVVETHFPNSVPMYEGSGVRVPAARTLAPLEAFAWKLDDDGSIAAVRVAPFTTTQEFDAPTDVRTVTIPTDAYYWGEVAATRRCETFTAVGGLTVGADIPVVYNDRTDSVRIGKVRASVVTAPVGADILVDVKLDGVSILSTPLAISAGTTTATVVPDVTTFTTTYHGAGVVWLNDAALTVEVLQVGSPGTEGETLSVQVYYG